MKNWEDDDDDEYCSTRQDLIDAASVADVIGIELEAVNFAAEYKERVFATSCASTRPGARPIRTCCATPRSSSRRSSTTRWRWAPSASPPATMRGVEERDGRFELLKGVDPGKDQSYFLHRLNQAQLVAHAVSRWASCRRPRCARSRAKRACPTTRRRTRPASASSASGRSANSSTATCRASPAPIRDARGRARRRAPSGLMFYTIGQRQGMGIGGVAGRRRRALVRGAARTSGATTLIVVQGHDHPLLCEPRAAARRTRAGSAASRRAAGAALRRQDALPPGGRALRADARRRTTRFALDFAQPQWAVTPGQSAVLYRRRGVPRRRRDRVAGLAGACRSEGRRASIEPGPVSAMRERSA